MYLGPHTSSATTIYMYILHLAVKAVSLTHIAVKFVTVVARDENVPMLLEKHVEFANPARADFLKTHHSQFRQL